MEVMLFFAFAYREFLQRIHSFSTTLTLGGHMIRYCPVGVDRSGVVWCGHRIKW
jgi:hypothetical protein